MEPSVETTALRLVAATAIGAALALRPWRLLMGRPLPRPEMAQAQILLAGAAALIMGVVGDSMAKAFGLVGLGGFVRFRSGLKDPRDAAVMFLLIGLGMACGHGSYRLALVGAALVAVLLVALDLAGPAAQAPTRHYRLSAAADDPVAAERQLRGALGRRNVLVTSCAVDLGGRRLEMELESAGEARLSELLEQAARGGMREVTWKALEPQAKEGPG